MSDKMNKTFKERTEKLETVMPQFFVFLGRILMAIVFMPILFVTINVWWLTGSRKAYSASINMEAHLNDLLGC